jgi:uncharacterized protein YbaA (DUF1428 family)
MARKAGRIWRGRGAPEYREYVGDDRNVNLGMPSPSMVKLKRGETVVFSWIGFTSRAHCDSVNDGSEGDALRLQAHGNQGGLKILLDACRFTGATGMRKS